MVQIKVEDKKKLTDFTMEDTIHHLGILYEHSSPFQPEIRAALVKALAILEGLAIGMKQLNGHTNEEKEKQQNL